MKHRYLAYGLLIASDSVVPGLKEAPDDRPPDLSLFCTPQPNDPPDWVHAARSLQRCLYYTLPPESNPDSAVMCAYDLGGGQFLELIYSDGCQFVIDGPGTRVWGTYSTNLDIEYLATYLAGPISGLVLRRKGIVPLHASCVELDGFAIAICGTRGAGKSTTAAALGLRGQPVLCEDISRFCERGDGFQIFPGYPRICLWPESVQNLMGSRDALPLITQNWDKRYLPLDGTLAQFADGPKELAAIYVLGNRIESGNAPRIDALKPADALLALVQNSYMNWMLDRRQRAAEFDVLSVLANRVAFREVTPHSDPTRLNTMCDLILTDASALITERRSTMSRS